MKKRVLITLVVLVLVVASMSLVACNDNKDKDIYPAWAYENAWEKESEEALFPADANLRIMSYNVLVEAWNKRIKTGISHPFDARAEQVSKIIEHYAPDVVGLQEADSKWHKVVKNEMTSYAFVPCVEGGSNYTTIIYNKDKVSYVDGGKVAYTNRSEKKMRFAAWALFEKGGKQFIVMNTHFDFGKDRRDMQISQMEEYGNLAKKLSEEKNAPVFLTGDYNAYDVEVTDKESPAFDWTQGVDLYEKFRDDHKDTIVDAKYLEDITKLAGEHIKYTDPTWDHIFITKNVSVKKFVVLSNNFYTSASDHYPIFIDAAI